MKMKRNFLIIWSMALLLCACTSKVETDPVLNTSAQAVETTIEETSSPETESEMTEPADSTNQPSKSIETSAPLTPNSVSTETQNTAFIDADALPMIDGSTACIPLMLQVVEEVSGMSPDDAQFYINSTGTNNCWNNLLNGDADIILAYEMPEATNSNWKSSFEDIDLEIAPIGVDALVFLVNEKNPVFSLTQQQLIDIYTGKTTNWSSVGGDDIEIAPFQRDASSGSQTLFRKLLMKDITPMKPTDRYIALDMGFLIESVANYNNAGNAIGYSVYYYVTHMKNDPSLRFLSVDGVAPNDDTIADGSYPLRNNFFAAIRADTPADSPARMIFDWLSGESGAQCLRNAGYIPA